VSKEKLKIRPIRCVVVSDKMLKSRVAEVVRLVKDAHVEKYIKRTTRIMFHDEKNESKIGDTVLIKSCRPLSAKKRFELASIVVRAK
jgi:small subunit ribosomal protein S17